MNYKSTAFLSRPSQLCWSRHHDKAICFAELQIYFKSFLSPLEFYFSAGGSISATAGKSSIRLVFRILPAYGS